MTLNQIAVDWGISEGSLSNWLETADVEERQTVWSGKDESEESRQLRRRANLLEQETVVLRRSAAYPWRTNVTPGVSSE